MKEFPCHFATSLDSVSRVENYVAHSNDWRNSRFVDLFKGEQRILGSRSGFATAAAAPYLLFFYFQNAIEDRGNYVFSYVDSLLVPLPFVKVLHSSLARIIPTDRSRQTPLKKETGCLKKKVLGKNKCDFVIRGPCITWYLLQARPALRMKTVFYYTMVLQ